MNNINHLKNKIHLCDCLEFIRELPDKCVDLVLTDPPYEQEAHGRGLAAKRSIYKEMSKYTSLSNDWYSEAILDEFSRICKFPNLFLFCGKRDLQKAMSYAVNKGFSFTPMQLVKQNPPPFTNNTWLSSEYAVHISDRKIIHSKDYNDKIPYFMTGVNSETKHPNEKSVPSFKRVIKNVGMDGVIFDPFSGSGTTAIACHDLGLDFICVEKDLDYHAASVNRLKEHQKQGRLF